MEEQAGESATPNAGWYPDPGGRHTYRYWNGATWTEHVFDGSRPVLDQASVPIGSEPARRRSVAIDPPPERAQGMAALLMAWLVLVVAASISLAIHRAGQGVGAYVLLGVLWLTPVAFRFTGASRPGLLMPAESQRAFEGHEGAAFLADAVDLTLSATSGGIEVARNPLSEEFGLRPLNVRPVHRAATLAFAVLMFAVGCTGWSLLAASLGYADTQEFAQVAAAIAWPYFIVFVMVARPRHAEDVLGDKSALSPSGLRRRSALNVVTVVAVMASLLWVAFGRPR